MVTLQTHSGVEKIDCHSQFFSCELDCTVGTIKVACESFQFVHTILTDAKDVLDEPIPC